MRISRPIAGLVGAGLVAVALVGVGAGATFTTSTASGQTVKAGTLHVAVSGATCTSSDASGCHALTLPDVGPVGSTFDSTPTVVTVANTGNIPAFFSAIQMSETHGADTASGVLRNELNVCIKTTDPSGTWVEANGPLATAVALTPTVKENPVKLMPGETATYQVEFYAGENSSCGTKVSDGPSTTTIWTGYDGGGYQTPASLTSDAQGGAVTPTLTFAFNG